MTREESEKYIKSKMCNNCSVYLGGGKCSDNCKVIEAIEALKQEPRQSGADMREDEKQCKNCKKLGTVNCSETYREPTINDNACEDFSPERKYTYG